MKKHTLLALGLCTAWANLFAQKIFKTSEWCAHYGLEHYAPPTLNALDGRSDSIDIQHIALELTITDLVGKKIGGKASLDCAAKLDGIGGIRLDLINLTVDSVRLQATNTPFTYNGKVITITFPMAFNTGQNFDIEVYYRGTPVTDASGWGGFYFQGQYAYNLGVGFAADPHNYGRVWFPCFDNFVERSTFTTAVTTTSDKPSFANGIMVADEALPNNLRKRTWQMNDPIPSYLACVALGPYTAYKDNIAGELGNIPVEIAVTPADTNKLKASFANLDKALEAYEHWYGPYRWDKVGYSVVPFNSGAMEHATNIAYMRAAVDGTLGSETLMAHELSHHWWGDLATCTTPEDMWLNEGWASFSEHLFLEWVYGHDRYIKEVEANFLDVLENTHVSEGGYRAVSGLPHSLTYGSHVYDKGAIVPHNLRAYLGDEQFRTGLRAVMDQTQMEDFSSTELRDKLAAATGVNLDDFFQNWVFTPGFTDFTLDSTQFLPQSNGTTLARAWVKQRLRGTNQYYQGVPLELAFLSQSGAPLYREGKVSGAQTMLEFELPADANPTGRVWVNTRSRITQARAVGQRPITNNAQGFNFAPAKLEIKVTDPFTDSIGLRVEHHYSMPDTHGIALPAGYTLSNRFWVIDGTIHPDANGLMTFVYDGRQQLDQLDRQLFQFTGPKEDSVRLLYRPHAGVQWQEHPAYTKNTLGSTTDRWGQLRASKVLLGEYAIGKGPSTVSTTDLATEAILLEVTPNPATTQVRLAAALPMHRMEVYDMAGKLALEKNFGANNTVMLDIQALPKGTYQIIAFTEEGLAVQRVVVQ
jgi:hypothetical protein